jgi:hypothetical protein
MPPSFRPPHQPKTWRARAHTHTHTHTHTRTRTRSHMAQGKAVLGKDKQPCVINLKMRLLAPCDKGSPGVTVPSHAASAPGAAAGKPGGAERDRNWEVYCAPLDTYPALLRYGR